MEAQEIRRVILKNIIVKNPNARYRLALPVIEYRRVDIPDFEQGYMDCPVAVDTDMARSCLFKNIGGFRIYYKLKGDYITLYVEGSGWDYPKLNDEILDKLSRDLHFSYNHLDLDAVLTSMDTEDDIVAALDILQLQYNVIIAERKGSIGQRHLAIQECRYQKIYDKQLGLMGVTAKTYKEKVNAEYWLNHDVNNVQEEV